MHPPAAAVEVVAEAATNEVGSSLVAMSNVVEVPRAVEVSVESRLVRVSVNDPVAVVDEVSVVVVSTVVSV